MSRQALAGGFSAPLLVATAVALLLICAQLAGTEPLQYHRERIFDGQLWRLLSAHVVHLGWGHALMNLLALALIAVVFPETLRHGVAALLCLTSLATIDAGLLLLRSDIVWYVGLSGVLHGYLAGACLLTERRLEGRVLLLGLATKLVWEQTRGALPSTAALAGGPVIVDAHLFGAIGGLICGLVILLQRRRRQAL